MRYLVLGQGLAGTLLSFELRRRGLEFRVLDDGQARSASLAASGLFAPLTGQRTALMWRAAEVLAEARESYRSLEESLGIRVFHEIPLYRVFTGPEQRGLYLRRAQEDSHKPFLGPPLDAGFFRDLGMEAPFGGMEVRHAGRLDVQGLLPAWRERLKKEGRLEEGPAGPEDLKDPALLDCRGLGARADRPWIPFQPAKGESLLLKAPSPKAEAIFYGSHFLLPLGSGRFRLGASYDREDPGLEPTAAKRAELEAGAARLCPGGFEVESQPTGIRPNVLGHFPLIGPAPEGGFVFNGLGSKGVLWAPWGAKVLSAHLTEGRPIPPEVSSERFHAQEKEKAEA